MTVIPVSACLFQRKAISKGFTGCNAGKGHSRHTIHGGGKEKAMPVNGGILRQPVDHLNGHLFPFAPAQQWCRELPVDSDVRSARSGNPPPRAFYPQGRVISLQNTRQSAFSARRLRPRGQQRLKAKSDPKKAGFFNKIPSFHRAVKAWIMIRNPSYHIPPGGIPAADRSYAFRQGKPDQTP